MHCRIVFFFLSINKRSNPLICCCSVAQSCPTLCNPMNGSMPHLPVLHFFPEFARIHVHCVGDAIKPYHSSGSSQCTSPKHPVSFIAPGLAICFLYDIIHVSMPFSQIIPPSPSPTESKSLFYISVSLLLSHIEGLSLLSF